MMSKTTKTLLALWLTTMLFSTVAWADGAGPGYPADLPKYMESPLIQGDFTVSYEPFDEGATPTHFTIHVVLEGTRPYVLRRSVTSESLEICEYQNRPMKELIEKYASDPRDQGVEKDFNLEGAPIISNIFDLKGYNCDEKHRAMLKGKLKIRVLPPEFF